MGETLGDRPSVGGSPEVLSVIGNHPPRPAVPRAVEAKFRPGSPSSGRAQRLVGRVPRLPGPA